MLDGLTSAVSTRVRVLARFAGVAMQASRHPGFKIPLTPYSEAAETPIQTFYDGPLFDPMGIRPGLRPFPGVQACGHDPDSRPVMADAVVGRTLTLTVDPAASWFGDALNVVDAPEEARADPRFPAFGWSGASLIGGFALTASRLSGAVELRFSEQVDDGYVGFRLRHPRGMRGMPGMLASPGGYRLATKGNTVSDCTFPSRGKLHLATGRIFDCHYNVRFFNSAIARLLSANSTLSAPSLLFPGTPQSGHVIGRIDADPDGRVTFNMHALMFLPLGHEARLRPIQMPAGDAGGPFSTAFVARGSSLHPFIRLRASGGPPSSKPPPAAAAPKPPAFLARYQHRTVRLRCLPGATDYGDIFGLNSPLLGGKAHGLSPLAGDVVVQFGEASPDGLLPYMLTLDAPDARLHPRFTELLKVLPPGTRPGLVGQKGFLRFPHKTYLQQNLSYSSDPQKVTIGVVDLSAPDTPHELVLRKFLFVEMMQKLIAVEARTPTDSFAYRTTASFEETPDGRLVLRAAGLCHVPYPHGYGFPRPGGGRMVIGPDSELTPFINILAAEGEETPAGDAVDRRYRGRELRRGVFRGPVELDLRDPRQGILSLGGRTHRARRVAPPRRLPTAPGGGETVLVELEIGRRREYVQVYLRTLDDGLQILAFSASEKFEFWADVTAVADV